MDPFRAFLLPWKKTGAPPGGSGKGQDSPM